MPDEVDGRDRVEALRADALQLAQNGEHEAALDCFQRARAADSARWDCYRDEAKVLLTLGRDEEAVSVLTSAVRHLPDQAEPLFRLGELEDRQGDSAAARRHLERASRLESGRADIWHCLGLACRHARCLPDAVEALRRATALAPADAGAWYDLAHALVDADCRDDAVTAFDAFLRLADEDQPARAAALRVRRLLQTEAGA